MSVASTVDEIDIRKVKEGQRARVTGNAFPGVTLEGVVTHVSSQARTVPQTPIFEVAATLDQITPEQRNHLRAGMSAVLEIIVYENENESSIIIPLTAVDNQTSGTYVTIVGSEGHKIKRQVSLGRTTIDGIEVLDGLEVGEVILQYFDGSAQLSLTLS